MKKLIFIVLIVGSARGFAQQDPQYSQYMFNQLVLNPAYAGSREALCSVIDLRQQWVSMPGAPQTACVSVQGPLPFKSVGIGGHLVYERIGPATWTTAYADYAYRVQIGRGKLAAGLSTGVVNYNFRTSELVFKNGGEVFANQYPGARTAFDVGAGLYFSTKQFYFGASATHLSMPKLYDESFTSGNLVSHVFFNLQPHIFVNTGYAFAINENLVINPSILAKMITAAPQSPSIDVNCNVLIKKRVWLGASYRLNYGAAGLIQYYISDNFKIGYCYDMGFNKIGIAGQSSHEIVLGYDFRLYKTKTLSPRLLFM